MILEWMLHGDKHPIPIESKDNNIGDTPLLRYPTQDGRKASNPEFSLCIKVFKVLHLYHNFPITFTASKGRSHLWNTFAYFQ